MFSLQPKSCRVLLALNCYRTRELASVGAIAPWNAAVSLETS